MDRRWIRQALAILCVSVVAFGDPVATAAPTHMQQGRGSEVGLDPLGRGLYTGVAVDAAGRVVLVGSLQEEGAWSDSFRSVVRRTTPDGRPDTSFSGDGQIVFAQDWPVIPHGVAMDGSRPVVAGTTSDGIGVYRLTSTGRLDRRFGVNGLARASIAKPGHQVFVSAVLVSPTGQIIVVGHRVVRRLDDTVDMWFIVRFTPHGTLDSAFGRSGLVRSVVHPTDPVGISAAVDSAGRVIVSGTDIQGIPTTMFVRRYTTTGRPDTTFGTRGTFTLGNVLSGHIVPGVTALDAAGRVVIMGSHRATGTYENSPVVLRLTRGGQLDRRYSGDGVARIDLGADADGRWGLKGLGWAALTPTGEVVGIPNGLKDRKFGVVRIGTNGDLLSLSFVGFGRGTSYPRAIAALPSGGVVIAGSRQVVNDRFPAFALVTG